MIIKKKIIRRGLEENVGKSQVVEATSSETEEVFGMQDFEEDSFEGMPVKENLFTEDNEDFDVDISDNPDDIDLFSLDNIDFTQRQERRRGDRRRGFRRVDDRNLISRAREEADAIREAASKEGYQEGLTQAKSDLESVRELFAQFMNVPQDVYEQIAPDILEISVDIAKKIIKKEVTQDPQILVDTIVEVLRGLSKEEVKILLRVNPIQVDITKQSIPEMLNLSGLDAKVTVLADESISEGGCMVTTANGVVDATIETQLSVISEALKEV